MQRSGSPSRKLDYKRELRELYGLRAGAPVIVDVPELSFLMVDGTGDPNTSRGYREGVEALFAVSYRVKFAVKRGSVSTTGSCRWRACGGSMTCRRSRSKTSRAGVGRP
jgi:hypothetical protein